MIACTHSSFFIYALFIIASLSALGYIDAIINETHQIYHDNPTAAVVIFHFDYEK